VSMQTPLQSVVPPTQLRPQLPIEHTLPPVQVVPQLPQLFGSFWVATHIPLHSVLPPTQSIPQVPNEQTSPVLQTVSQSPQWLGSFCVSTQMSTPPPSGPASLPSPHRVVPPAQNRPHLLSEQMSPSAQTVPHAPQFFGSILVSTQVSPHK